MVIVKVTNYIINTIKNTINKQVNVHRFNVQRSGLGTRIKLKTRIPHKKCWFCHIIATYHVPDALASPVMYTERPYPKRSAMAGRFVGMCKRPVFSYKTFTK